MTPDFLNMQTLNMYMTDFKAVASDAIATIVEERTVFISSFDFYHDLADDILLLATHWPDIVGARSFDGDKKVASDLCEEIIMGKPSHNSGLIFCDMDNAPLRVHVLQFLLEVTDLNKAACDVWEEYACLKEEMATVMKMVRSFFAHCVGELNPDHFNIDRVGPVQKEEQEGDEFEKEEEAAAR